jgi:HAAS
VVVVNGPTTIDAYLDRLLLELRGRARDVRRVLAEAEDHLRDAAAEGLAAGLSEPEAEAAAVERFGSPRVVAARFTDAEPLGVGRRAIIGQLASSLTLVAAVGLLAIGASGVLSMGMRSLLGDRFVAGDLPGVTYTAERCREFFEYHPEASSCAAAATAHHADEVESYRLAAGVLGAVALGGWLWHRRRSGARAGADGGESGAVVGVLPDGFGAVVGASLFGVAGAILGVQALGQMVGTGASSGPGQWLSGALVSTFVASWYAVALVRLLASRARAGARSQAPA